jgi:dTDP-4-amino-4,6-dideoxygalactose transaminase
MSNKPAILGGTPAFTKPFPRHNTIGKEEKKAILKVLDSGSLSGFVGAWVPEFYGGEQVKKLEKAWAKHFKVKHAVAVNSATSGLNAAIGALGIEPGDEVITTPTTMTATCTAILVYQAIPIFADICPHTYCINPKEVERLITEKTRAILAVNIYGETAEFNELRKIANKHGLKIIEDAAQSAGGMYNGRHSGTLGDIGIYSLNRHKLIQCGEGGVCVTNDDDLAERLQLIRNHAEAVVEGKGTQNLVNMVGFNYRMTEMEAAVGLEQLKKLKRIGDHRIEICKAIMDQLKPFEGIIPPLKSPLPKGTSIEGLCRSATTSTRHTYYYLSFKLDKQKLGISRNALLQALNAEGLPFEMGGYRPVYLQPLYQKKIAFGSKGYPFTAEYYGKDVNYNRGICPVAEQMWFEDLFYFPIDEVMPALKDVLKFRAVFDKILSQKDEIEKKVQKA